MYKIDAKLVVYVLRANLLLDMEIYRQRCRIKESRIRRKNVDNNDYRGP